MFFPMPFPGMSFGPFQGRGLELLKQPSRSSTLGKESSFEWKKHMFFGTTMADG